jgi:RNA polymerase sigma-70 factor (ECF subfamily)
METSLANGTYSALASSLRGELKRHCYRMMGGIQDAEDCVQETLLRGWREYSTLRDASAARPWLYSVATRVCLDALRKRKRRQSLFGPSLDEIEPGTEPWVEPWPGDGSSPVAERGQDMRLAFVSLLHRLSPRSRAVLLLHDLVGMSVAEAAVALGLTLASARSALQRARATLSSHPQALSDDISADAYVEAWNAGDVGRLIDLLHKDIVVSMPPWQRSFRGRDEVAHFMYSVWPRYDGFSAVATMANDQPCVAVYASRDGGDYNAHSLHVLGGVGLINEIVLYAPPLGAELIKVFGLPATL